jgi:uncharacterized membrane protein
MALAAMGLAPTGHFLGGSGLIAWPAAIAAWIWLARWRGTQAPLPFEAALHIASLWLFVVLLSVESWWQVGRLRIGDDAWQVVMSALPAILAIAAILSQRARWPVVTWPLAYTGVGAAGLVLYLFFWTLGVNAMDGSAHPLPYLPIANPIEITQCLALAAAAGWILFLKRVAPERWRSHDAVVLLWPAWGLAAFALLTAMLLRVLHHWVGIAWEFDEMVRSTTVQSALSIFWGLIALTGMVVGTRVRERPIWFASAALLGVVLLKMFLVDLSRTGTVARIVSFIGVGILMLIIGRFSPVPPARREQEAT